MAALIFSAQCKSKTFFHTYVCFNSQPGKIGLFELQGFGGFGNKFGFYWPITSYILLISKSDCTLHWGFNFQRSLSFQPPFHKTKRVAIYVAFCFSTCCPKGNESNFNYNCQPAPSLWACKQRLTKA